MSRQAQPHGGRRRQTTLFVYLRVGRKTNEAAAGALCGGSCEYLDICILLEDKRGALFSFILYSYMQADSQTASYLPIRNIRQPCVTNFPPLRPRL